MDTTFTVSCLRKRRVGLRRALQMSKVCLQFVYFLPPLRLCPLVGPKDRCCCITSMLLATAICFGFVIKMCTATTTNPDLFNDVFVCVEKDAVQNVTMVTWTIAAYIQAKCCDLLYFENQTSVASVIPNLPPSGTFDLSNLKQSALYVVQITCFASSCDDGQHGSRKSYKSSEVSFISGSHVSKVCSISHPSHLSYGQMLVCIQETQGEFSHVVQWWSSQPTRLSSCTLYYTSFNTMDSQHRTETFRDLPVNGSLLLTEGAAGVRMECNDSNNGKQSSGMAKYGEEDSMQRVCSSIGVHPTLPNTAKILPTQPTHFSGFQVSSLAQGLVLAFSIFFVSLAMSVLAYKRYKRYLRRRSQMLLRIETDEEANEEAAMQEFQRMV